MLGYWTNCVRWPRRLTVCWEVDAGVHRQEVIDFALAAVLGRELGSRELLQVRRLLLDLLLIESVHHDLAYFEILIESAAGPV